MDSIKRAVAGLVKAITGLQGLSWLLGVYEKLTELVRDNTPVAIGLAVTYCFIHYICVDSATQLQKIRYAKVLKGAPLRRRTPPKS